MQEIEIAWKDFLGFGVGVSKNQEVQSGKIYQEVFLLLCNVEDFVPILRAMVSKHQAAAKPGKLSVALSTGPFF